MSGFSEGLPTQATPAIVKEIDDIARANEHKHLAANDAAEEEKLVSAKMRMAFEFADTLFAQSLNRLPEACNLIGWNIDATTKKNFCSLGLFLEYYVTYLIFC